MGRVILLATKVVFLLDKVENKVIVYKKGILSYTQKLPFEKKALLLPHY